MNNTATYKHLKPGKYEFKIRSFKEGGSQYQISEAYNIKIKPHWYESMLFKLLMVLLCIAIVYAFYRMKTASLERELILRSEFKEELSQDKKQV